MQHVAIPDPNRGVVVGAPQGGVTWKDGEAGSLLGYLTAGGKVFLLRESGTVVSASMLHIKSFPRQ